MNKNPCSMDIGHSLYKACSPAFVDALTEEAHVAEHEQELEV